MSLKFENVSYSFKEKTVLRNINCELNINRNCIALVGHNGAGKTTLLNIICGILEKFSGNVIFSDSLEIAYLPCENPIYDQFTVKENILFWFQLYNNEKFSLDNRVVSNVLNDFKLYELLDKKVCLLSNGEKRKVALACILLGEAELLVLDEPFNGLDISSISELCRIINNYKERGKGFIISSHQLDILNKISNHILILKDGELVFNSLTDDSISILDAYLKAYE